MDRSLPMGGSAHLIVPLWLLSLLLFCLEADPAQCDFRGRGVFSLFRQFRGSPRGGMGLWTSAPLRYSGPGELERLCASVSPSVNGEPRVLASEGTRGIHPDDWRLDSRARTHRHPPGPAAVPGLSRGSRAQRGSQPCLTGRVTAGGESAPQCSVQRIRMRPARCWWAICDCDPHRAASPSPGAEHLLRAEAGRGQASCGAGLCREPAPCSPVQPGKVGPCLPAYHHLFTEELTSSSLAAYPRSRSQNSNPELDTTPRLPAVLFLASVSPSVKSKFLDSRGR